MDQEMLFTATKWDILSLLSNEPKSPIQLAKIAKTSVANVSQQLRLLEMAGFVSSVRVPNRDKGQPRIVYSLTKHVAFLIVVGNKFAEKRQIVLDPINQATLRIWMLPDQHSHYYIEKAFWALEPDLEKIRAILVDPAQNTLYILSDDAAVKKKYTTLAIKRKGHPDRSFKCQFFSQGEIGAIQKKAYPIYDPHHSFSSKSIEQGEVEQ